MKTCLITGANRGLGFEIAKKMYKEGFLVFLSGKKLNKVLKSANYINKSVIPVCIDVLDADCIKSGVKFLLKHFKKIDILINNAGVYCHKDEVGNIFNLDINVVKQTIETNLYGPLRLIKEVLPHMIKNQYGRIVNVSSVLSQISTIRGGKYGYRLSKIGLNALTAIVDSEIRNMAIDIKVNSVGIRKTNIGMGDSQNSIDVTETIDEIFNLATLNQNGPSGKFFIEGKIREW